LKAFSFWPFCSCFVVFWPGLFSSSLYWDYTVAGGFLHGVFLLEFLLSFPVLNWEEFYFYYFLFHFVFFFRMSRPLLF